MSAQQLLNALLAFPGDKLDKNIIQYVYDNMSSGSLTVSSSSEDKPKKTRKTKSKDDKKDDDKTEKPKRKLSEALKTANVARNAFYKVKKEEGMSYKDFNALWKSMTSDEKNAIKVKYGSSPSSSAESTSAEQSENEDEHKQSDSHSDNQDDDVTIDDIEESINQLNPTDEKKSSSVEKKPVVEEKKITSTKAKKSTKK